ncbi:MAG: Phenylalanine-tRNA ligase beta subunit [Candidatus Falkowbacteria bacterium GW2011_GWA2_39_24]|uniref:Phenylalanine-tRNA ligase beta subunit n=1 Tax=Candidatus Falkowbacteria bacterium GW2011_GWA2_39_24 TaxID=1618634 RepID=A0A0G0NRC8_9BACT|nr:MAG: Phenylalanine-tRNA ligase beta subunit [Candidatus Falkowbacteria bacterium GW2011_GWA2_39_24]
MWSWLNSLLGGQSNQAKTGEQITKFPGVVVGRVLSVNKHPNADRLQLAVVDVGQEQLDIVCGGPNLAVEQLVPVALIGAQLPNGLVIKLATIRGSQSQGMICAEDELGLGTKHETIIVLSGQAKVGGPIDNFLPNN